MLLSGALGKAADVLPYLSALDHRVGRPVYFVLGQRRPGAGHRPGRVRRLGRRPPGGLRGLARAAEHDWRLIAQFAGLDGERRLAKLHAPGDKTNGRQWPLVQRCALCQEIRRRPPRDAVVWGRVG